MSNSNKLLNELKQKRYGTNIEDNNVLNNKMSLKLPPDYSKENTNLALVNFGLMALVTVVMEPIFLILAYYLFK